MMNNNTLTKIEEVAMPIHNAEGYFITNFGRAFSNKSGRMKQLTFVNDSNQNKKKSVNLKIDGKRKKCFIDELVGSHFVEGYSDERCYLIHKDLKWQNSHYLNLEWVNKDEYLKNKKQRYKLLGLETKWEKIGITKELWLEIQKG
jgi:hypothetical protein